MSVTPTDLRALVAIDLGAESCRVSLLRWIAGQPTITLVYRFRNEAQHRPGTHGEELHWPIDSILDELHTGLQKCAELAPEGIRSIAVDGWAVDYVRLGDDGTAVGDPFCYRDMRTVASEKQAHALIPAASMREITGIQLGRINTAYQLLADTPALQTRSWLNLPEYVLYRLGGDPVAERTNASHTQLLDLSGNWSEEIFSALNLDVASAPRVVAAGTDVGKLSGELKQLPAFANTRLIAPACHDTASAIAGIGDDADDWAYISSGTWSLIGTLVDQPVNTLDASAANFTNLAAADGKFLFHKGLNGLWLLRQCMDTWCAAGVTLTIPELVLAAEAVAPPLHLLDIDDPDLLLQGDMPARMNAQLQRRSLPTIDPDAANAPAVASLIFHSLAASYAEVVTHLKRLTGKPLRALYIVGGGSQNKLLNQLTEQATGFALRGTETESSTLGNFAVQLSSLERPVQEETAATWASRLKVP